jgi:hypothetical protein
MSKWIMRNIVPVQRRFDPTGTPRIRARRASLKESARRSAERLASAHYREASRSSSINGHLHKIITLSCHATIPSDRDLVFDFRIESQCFMMWALFFSAH